MVVVVAAHPKDPLALSLCLWGVWNVLHIYSRAYVQIGLRNEVLCNALLLTVGVSG